MLAHGLKSLCATTTFSRGTCLRLLRGNVYKVPTPKSIEIDPFIHVEDDMGRFMNHSFTPSCVIDRSCIVAIRDISVGEELTFDYNINEKKMYKIFIQNIH